MKKSGLSAWLLLPALLPILLAYGCKPMTPEERAAWDKKMAAYHAENLKKRAEEERASQLEERQKANGGQEVAAELRSFVAQATQHLRSKGYKITVVPDNRGFAGAGVHLLGEKKEYTDLKSNVTNNIIGNMLGADRGTIIKENVNSITIYICRKWNADYTAEAVGKLAVANNGFRWNINQRDEKVDEAQWPVDEETNFRNDVIANSRH